MISLKKLLAVALSAAMVLGTMAIPAFADESVSENAAKIGDTEYATLQDAFAKAKKDDTITLLKDIELTDGINIYDRNVLSGITIEGNGKTITSKIDTKTAENTTALRFGDPNQGLYATGVKINNLKMVGSAKYAIFLSGGTTSEFNNLTISGNYSMSINLYGTHGATFTNCDITNDATDSYYVEHNAVWSNVTYINPVRLVNSKIGVITINGYAEGSNTFAPKIYVGENSETKIYSFANKYSENSNVVPNKLYCIDPKSTGTYTVQTLTSNTDESITISDPITPVAKANVIVTVNKSDQTFETDILFDSLAGAVAAVKDGGTVTLLGDAEDNGIVIDSNRNLTVDFGGHTYTIDNPLVGSANTETNGFQLLKDSNITFKNGKITSSKAYKCIQNYSNLTLEDITVELTTVIPANSDGYTISNNNGNIVFKGNTNIIAAKEGAGNPKVAFDCYYWPSAYGNVNITIDKSMTGIIDGPIEKGYQKSYTKDGNTVTVSKEEADANSKITIYAGTFTTDASEYVAKGYMAKNNDNGTYTVEPATATVVDTAKSSGIEVTLGDLDKNDKIELDKDVTYSVILDTVKNDDKATVDEIKNANPGKTVIAYDIYVEKTEDGVKSEVDGVTNQKVTLKLPTKVKEGGEVKVYHNGIEISDVTISEDRMSVSFTAPSFSTYTFVYDADALTDSDITKNIKVEFEKVTDSEYDIVLKSTDGKKINGLLTADLTFALTQGTTGLVNYEITPTANMSLLVNGNRYTFSFDGINAHSATGGEIVIGKVKFNGYCSGAKFNVVDTATTNLVNTTKAVDSIVEYYVPGGDGTNTGILNATASIDDINLAQETANLTVNVSFPNAIVNQVAAYQDMKVTVSGNGANEVVKLGEDVDDVAFANDTYTVEFADKLVKGNTYTVTIEGAGYRTARYTVSMTGAKTLNFWNNVKDTPAVIEEGSNGTGVNTNFLAGDIVKDGQINVYDLSAVISYFGTDNLVDNHPTYAKYDLNRDGVIDSKDVAFVLVSWGK